MSPAATTETGSATQRQPGKRLTFVHEVVVRRPAAEVFAYVSDFNRAHEWRTEVVTSTMEPAGPMRLGSRLHEVAAVSGRRVVTESVIDSFEPGRRFTFAHVSGMLPVSGENRVEESAGGTRLTYTLHVGLPGLWAVAAPYLRWSGRRTIRQSFESLRTRLDSGAHVS